MISWFTSAFSLGTADPVNILDSEIGSATPSSDVALSENIVHPQIQ